MAAVDVASELASRVVHAVRETLEIEISQEEAVVRPAGAGREWDYQSNAAMALAKRVGKPSRDVAAAVAGKLAISDLALEPAIGGPGFINIRLRDEWLASQLRERLQDERLGVPQAPQRHRAVIDYSAPNVAKEMHVGHLRSTIVGDALVRILSFAGHEVIPQNHLGDWGTPFGMLIEHMVDEGVHEAPAGGHAIGDLNAFYQSAREKFDADPSFQDRARERVVRLQAGDDATLALWRDLVSESQRHFEEVYRLLGVRLTPEHLAPESLYNDKLAEVVQALAEQGLAVESDGALCVFPPGFKGRDGEPLPLIVRKQDGGYTYDTTDLAAIRYRILELASDTLLYVVGAPQRIHFAMVFEAARLAGWLTGEVDARHIQFGSVLGEDGKMLRTRAGSPIRLVDLLNEATERAEKLLVARGDVPEDQRGSLARAVGIGAVKYADLSTDRDRDYVFSFDRMLALDGNTSVYLQYANARARSVLRKAGGAAAAAPEAIRLSEPQERELALWLLRFPVAVQEALLDYRPHRLATYLYETAVAFSVFYESCPVLTADDEDVRSSRLALCELTSRVLVRGLDLLGIESPEQL